MADVNQLIQELANADDKRTKCSVISELGNLRDEAALRILIKCLNQEDDNEIKSYAADAIEKIGGKKACQMLIRLLRNHSWVTRMKAAETLGEICERKAVSPLIRVLRNDSEASVKEWAAISLGKIGDKKAIQPLIETLTSDSHWEVRMEAANALGFIKDKQSRKALVEAFYRDKDYQVSWASASALARINDSNSKKLLSDLTSELVKILQSEVDETVLSAAARTLGDIGNELAAKTMIKTMKVSKEMVKLELSIALGKIAKRFNYKNREEFIDTIQ